MSVAVLVVAMLTAGLLDQLSVSAQLSRPQAAQVQYSPQLVSEIKKFSRLRSPSDYAYDQLAHLCNNIGPRLSGSPQAQAAATYVAAELRRLGLEVKMEKVMVPHWVRGQETGELTEFAGMAPNTTQKIVLTALGGSVATRRRESRPKLSS